MILTCPNCAAQFFVEDGAIGASGRTVRCGKCAHIWEETVALVASPPKPKATPPPRPPRPEPKIKRPTKPKRGRGRLVWGALVVVVVAVVGVGILLPQRLVDFWPPVAKLYERMGVAITLPPGWGLALDSKNRRDIVGGVPVLVVEGSISNHSGRVRPVPRLRFTLRDEKGVALQDWTLRPPGGSLADGQRTTFKTKLKNPNKGAVDVSIEFVADE